MKSVLIPHKTPYKKIRLGHNYDGGYILLEELLGEVLFSYGIGDDDSFERDCEARGMLVLMHDPTIVYDICKLRHFAAAHDPTIIYHSNKLRHFAAIPFDVQFPKHLAGVENITLKLDVEGHEWYGLRDCDASVFSQINQMVVEFHNMHDNDPLKIPIISRLLQYFTIFHMHGNDFGGVTEDGLPHALEISFINNKFGPFNRETEAYPIEGLDFSNSNQGDYKMDWWLQPPITVL